MIETESSLQHRARVAFLAETERTTRALRRADRRLIRRCRRHLRLELGLRTRRELWAVDSNRDSHARVTVDGIVFSVTETLAGGWGESWLEYTILIWQEDRPGLQAEAASLADVHRALKRWENR